MGSGFSRTLANPAKAGFHDIYTELEIALAPVLGDVHLDIHADERRRGADEAAPQRHRLQTKFDELNADISPDGKWIAYQSDESGAPEIYVRPFPDVNGGRWQVSTNGGRTPAWSRDGRELFFIVGDGTMMATPIEAGTAFVARTPVKLFSGNFYLGGANSIGRTYSVAPDGRRFLMIKADGAAPIALTVVLNVDRRAEATSPDAVRVSAAPGRRRCRGRGGRGALALLFVTALIACAAPAWRAIKVSPLTALRSE